MTVAGEFSGRHKGGESQLGASGSWAKAQPPAARETRHSGFLRQQSFRNMTLSIAVILSVSRIAAKEFQSELPLIEAHENFSCVG